MFQFFTIHVEIFKCRHLHLQVIIKRWCIDKEFFPFNLGFPLIKIDFTDLLIFRKPFI